MTPGFSSTYRESPTTRQQCPSAFFSELLFANVHRWVVLLLTGFDSDVPFRCAFCCKAAAGAVNSGLFSCWALPWSLIFHNINTFSLPGVWQSQKMLDKGKCGDSRKPQTSKEAFIASCCHHPRLTCQLCLSCSLGLGCVPAFQKLLGSDNPGVNTTLFDL